jgi:hypothetical protein
MKRNAVASVLTMAFERLLLMGNRWAPGPASLALVLRSHVLTIRSAGGVPTKELVTSLLPSKLHNFCLASILDMKYLGSERQMKENRSHPVRVVHPPNEQSSPRPTSTLGKVSSLRKHTIVLLSHVHMYVCVYSVK